MRCPTCGTENAPDSRFCGGCGARLTPAEQRLAPTQKISDDAAFPRREIQAAAAGRGLSSPPVPAPAPSVPPGYVAPVSQVSEYRPPSKPPSKPPNGSAKSMPPAQVAPQIMTPPSLSMPIPARRPWGLIMFVLVIDLGLAGVGAWMLSQGLSP